MPRILFIDDNRLFRSLFRQQLERTGHEVLEAAEGKEALRLHQEQPADLVVCDLFMPGKDGLETIKELRKSSPVPVIAITGDGPPIGSTLLDVAQHLGASKVLKKPFDTETLLETMREAWKEQGKPAPSASGN